MKSSMSIQKGKSILNITYPDTGDLCVRKQNLENKNYDYDLVVIVPVYSVEDYLDRCIQSIINQKTDFPFQLILINDGSTDLSKKICDKYSNFENVFVIDKKNSGVSASRNIGIERAKAKYIMFVDSKDILAENAIQLLMQCTINNDYDLIEGNYKVIDQSDHIKCENRIYPNNIMELTGFPWGKIYNIHLFENIKFPKGYWFKDTINHMIIYPICRSYKHISDNVYYYRVNSEGASALAKHQIKSLDAFYILQRLMKDMQKLQIENDEYFQKYILKAIRLCYQRTRHLNGEVKKSVFTCVRDMYIHQIYNEHYKFVGKDRVLVNALLKNNYLLYKLNCFLML